MARIGSQSQTKTPLPILCIAALGVVYGDIGTSPLYAFKEAFGHAGGLSVTPANVFGVLSMMFWALTLVVSLKYVLIVLRFDNNGEGGILALLALATRLTRERPRLAVVTAMLGIFGASLFFGDAIITPAISVLSAVEGITLIAPAFERWIVPVTLGILVALFAIQHRGTGSVGQLFGRIMLIWFAALGGLGIASVIETPGVLAALDPRHALSFIVHSPGIAFIVLGAVFLAMTGAEALYADMGHFGRKPIQLAWFGFVFPALMLNYFGQGALVLRDPEAVQSPFYLLAPVALQPVLVLLATMAAVIASQATISGAFSMTQQATRLGYLPRVPTLHTSALERGQIYIPQMNWLMLALVVLVVVSFKSSGAIAAAYGIAVSATMVIDSALIGVVLWSMRDRPNPAVFAAIALVAIIEILFFASNSTKLLDGGWLPLVCALAVFTLLTTWKRAREVIAAREHRQRIPIEQFTALFGPDVPRVPGTAIYLTPDPTAIPVALMHNLKHNKVLHERIVFLHIADADRPRIDDAERVEVEIIDPHKVYVLKLRYGFMEEPDVPRGLELAARYALRFEPMDTTFFLGRTTIAAAKRRGLFTWRRELFRLMQRNAPAPAEYYKLPPERVIELGTRVTL